VGSADAVASGCADVVLANISPEAIVRLGPDLLRVRRPGGVLLASGIESGEVAGVQAKMPQARETRNKGDWALMAF
jgi:ribosomal protein L11 methylase PrmA